MVVAADLPPGFPAGPDATIVGGAGSGAGLAAALAMSMLPRSAEPLGARLAWTVSGRPLRAGRAVTFPEPVGSLWAGWGENPLPWPDVASCPAPTDSTWKAVRVDLKFRDAEGYGSWSTALPTRGDSSMRCASERPSPPQRGAPTHPASAGQVIRTVSSCD